MLCNRVIKKEDRTRYFYDCARNHEGRKGKGQSCRARIFVETNAVGEEVEIIQMSKLTDNNHAPSKNPLFREIISFFREVILFRDIISFFRDYCNSILSFLIFRKYSHVVGIYSQCLGDSSQICEFFSIREILFRSIFPPPLKDMTMFCLYIL